MPVKKSPLSNHKSYLKQLSWDNFYSSPLTDKLGFFSHNGRIFDCLFSKQFDRKTLTYLFKLADKIRAIAGTKRGLDWLGTLLSHKRAVLYFAQPSTRTFLSFNNACQILGIKTSDIRSVTSSSEAKGETPEDTLETFHSYTDMVIIRHANDFIAEKAAWMFNQSTKPIPVINAGSGPIEHPTQALLDVYTLHRAFKGKVEGKTVVMIGDLKRGRTIRSLIYMLDSFKDIRFIFLSPKELTLPDEIKSYLNKNKIKFEETDDLEDSLKKADVIYITRIQDEYDKSGESRLIDYTKFYIKEQHLQLMKKNCVILHPLPRRSELEPAIDNDSRAWYWHQEVNGLWIRTALIAYIFNQDKVILKRKS